MIVTSSHRITRLAALIAKHQRCRSDRLHASGDTVARQHRWDITVTTERLGFGGRVYRDHQFATRAPGHPCRSVSRPSVPAQCPLKEISDVRHRREPTG